MWRRIYGFVCCAIVLCLTACMSGCGSSEQPKTTRKSMQVLRSLPGPSGFQVVSIPGFIKGWDNVTNPVLYALITSPEQYDRIVSSTPYGIPPDLDTYSSHDLIVVSQVSHAPLADWSEAFDVDSASENGDILTVNFHFTPPTQYSTWDASLSFGIMFPKKSYSKIVMVENGVQVGELQSGDGQWCVPPR